MSGKLVQAVLFARYNPTNFKALYGRLKGSTTYTKDYIQIPATVSARLKPVLGESANGDIKVQYVWPGGTQSGEFHWSTDRYHLNWATDTPPLPWKLGQIGANPATTLPGDTAKRDETAADAQLASIEGSDVKPWLLAVKLANDGNRLHLRVYFEHPPAGFEDRGLIKLPQKIREEIAQLGTAGTGFVDWSGGIMPQAEVKAKKLVQEILEALARDPNVLLVGPPGTGKSVALEDLRNIYSKRATKDTPTFNPDSWAGDWGAAGADARSEALVFHPSYSYENFVAGLFPTTHDGKMELEAKAGPLLCLSHWVGESADRRALLILDEFNRGSAAAIFGDTLSLLDKDKRSAPGKPGTHIQRPYPRQKMPVPEGYRYVASAASEEVGQEVRLPAGVHIVAAMNSTDRSVAPLDAAMRRRFTVIRVRPDYETLAEHLGLDPSAPRAALPQETNPVNWTHEQVSSLAVQVLESLNGRIEYCLGEDFLLGHALVWGLGGASPIEKLNDLARAIDAKVVPTLRMTFVDQDEVLAAVLGVGDNLQVGHGEPAPFGVVAYWRAAPTALAAITPRRLMVQTLHSLPNEQQLSALIALTKN
jgi:5-methylcytosine-specific restriction enzyme B